MQHDIGDDTILSSTCTVMTMTSPHATPNWQGMIGFREIGWEGGNGPDHARESRRRLLIPAEVWREMGAPDTITLTVEPGDRLNVEL